MKLLCVQCVVFQTASAVQQYYDDISISFQEMGHYLATSWVEDNGNIYSLKQITESHTSITRNLSFGWNRPLTSRAWHVDISTVNYQQKYIETGITAHDCGRLLLDGNDSASSCDVWNIGVANGFYRVQLGVGKPVSPIQPYDFTVLLENEPFLAARYAPNENLTNPKWLHVQSGVVEVLDHNLTVQPDVGSNNLSFGYILLKRIKCGNLSKQFQLPPHTTVSGSAEQLYYPSIAEMVCEPGYETTVNVLRLRCDIDGKWAWDVQSDQETLSNMQCTQVDCGRIEDSALAPYDAHVYWQSTYATAIVICNSKEVQFVDELVCTTSGAWRWKHGNMQIFHCPSFFQMKNTSASVFSQYVYWFLAAIILGGFGVVALSLQVYAKLYNAYMNRQKYAYI